MLTWKSRAISRIVDRRAFASAPGKSALCVSESSCPVGMPRGNPLPASCWGFGSMANPDRSTLNSNLKNSPVWLRLQLKSVIKCITPKNRHFPGCPGFRPRRINLLFTGRFEGRNDSRLGDCASRLDHAGAFGNGSVAGATRGNELWKCSWTSVSALLNLAAPGLFSACGLPGAGVLPHNR